MTKWRCTVCGYISEGKEPPEACPICGVDASLFEKIEENETINACLADVNKALRAISYGLYIVSSRKGDKLNGQCANTVFQITSDPVQIAVGINKNNLTHEYISDSGAFSVNILNQDGMPLVKNFGFRSGREADKFAEVVYELGSEGLPIIKDCLASLECKVVGSIDLGTHTLFVGEVLCGRAGNNGEPMTYAQYHQFKNQPPRGDKVKNSITWRCKVCQHIHEGNEPPEACPVCGVGREEFEKVE